MKNAIKKFVKYLLECPIHFCVLRKRNLVFKTNWIYRLLKRYLFILKFNSRFPLHIFVGRYVRYLDKQRVLKPSLYNELKTNWIRYYKSLDERQRFLMSKLFYEFHIFDDEICELLINDALSFNNSDYKRYLFLDISRMSFFYHSSIYPQYYLDRRRLLESVALDNKLNFYKTPKSNEILIITYTLGDTLFNSATRLVKMISDGLIEYGDKISVICLDSFLPTKKERKALMTTFENINPKGLYNSVKGLLNKEVDLYFIDEGNRKTKDDKLVDLINKINPKIIIDITDEYSYQSYYYSKVYPTIYIPMRNYSSSSFYTYTLGVKWKYDLLNQIYHSVDEKKIIEWSFPEYVPPKSEPISRNQLGLKNDSFVFVTIGKNESELDNEFVDSICNMLQEHKDMQWIIVGGNPPSYLSLKYKDLLEDNSIISRPFEKNLSGLCASCDVVLRANTTAGSGGTAIAIMAGCPVVMTSMVCDPMRWLGKDYSQVDDVKKLPIELLRLKDDKEYYLKKQKECLALVNEAIDARKRWKQLADFYKNL